jgi:hypothetical protein
MENEKLGQETAFPSVSDISHNGNDTMISGTNGMSKRFYAACMAMSGMLSAPHITIEKSIEQIITESYLLSDELLKQEIL